MVAQGGEGSAPKEVIARQVALLRGVTPMLAPSTTSGAASVDGSMTDWALERVCPFHFQWLENLLSCRKQRSTCSCAECAEILCHTSYAIIVKWNGCSCTELCARCI